MDAVFKALADKSRRRLLDKLFRKDGQSLGKLCARAGMTRFGVMKHLRVLEKAGLVVARKRGREKLHFLNPMPIRQLQDRWVGKYRAPFADALLELKADLEEETNMPETQLYELFIRATPEKLWQALTAGAVSKRYFFGETIHGDFRKGSPWHCTGASGKRDVEGTVLESDPPRKLSVTWHVLYDETLTKELSKVTYLIEPRGAVCKLTVLHDLAEAPQTAKHVGKDGWQLVLSSLKTLMETGESMPAPSEAA
jgi:uncharacterized protein YndB with AHSA1/START domain